MDELLLEIIQRVHHATPRGDLYLRVIWKIMGAKFSKSLKRHSLCPESRSNLNREIMLNSAERCNVGRRRKTLAN